MSFAVLFPGQGSQFVGMGADLFQARPDLLGEPADRILGWSLRRLCLEGPEDDLTRTEHAQPALFALGYALWEELSAALGEPPAAAAGHSLGEYTALAAAGAIDYEPALEVVSQRGRAMAEAADLEPSGMAALIGADLETAEALAAARRQEGGRLTVANVNAPGQVVVAGGVDDLEWVEEHAREMGVRRSVRLRVAGAFHSPFMEAATGPIQAALSGLVPAEPRFPVYANVTGRPMPADRIVDLLAVQVVSPVRFSDSLAAMAADGVDVFVHVGPGDVTAGMVRKCLPDAETLVVGDLSDVPAAAKALSSMGESGGD